MINKKRFTYLMISIFLVFAFVAIAEVQAQPSDISRLKAKAAREGQVLVIVGLKLPGGFTPEGHLHGNEVAQQRRAIADIRKALKNTLQGFNAKVYREWNSVHAVAVKVDRTALDHLANSPLVTTIQEDLPLNPLGYGFLDFIGANVTWNAGIGGRGQTVVIVDTGIDTNHPYFGGRVVAEACFSNGHGDGVTLCPNGANSQIGPGSADVTIGQAADVDHCDTNGTNKCYHGTYVAGIAAGRYPIHTLHINGVAPEANMIAIQAATRQNDDASCGGTGKAPCITSWSSDVISALDYVNTDLHSYNISSINISLGGGYYTSACDTAFATTKTAVDNLLSNGIATCIASGNDGWTDGVSYPGCISTAVTVGAVTDSDSPPPDSVIFNMGSLVDLLAPGSCVASSMPGNNYSNCADGTSVAAPQVTGAFAVIRSIAPTKSIEDTLNLLKTTGVLVTDNRPVCPTCSATGITRKRLQLDAAVPVTYTIKDLGTLGWPVSWAYGINNSGQVAGGSYLTGYTAYHAFLYSGGTMQDLGTLGGTNSGALGINDSGQVVGSSHLTGYTTHAFLYDGTTMPPMHDLGTLGGTISGAYGINNSGEAAGGSGLTGDTAYHAFLYSGGTMHDLGTLGGTTSWAYGINDSGQVVGNSELTGDTAAHAFLYSGGTMYDLGTLGGTVSVANGINNSGQVAGISDLTGDTTVHAFLYDATTMPPMHDLGTLGGTISGAYGINNSSQVVGRAQIKGAIVGHAFLYSGGTMYDLSNMIPSSSGWEGASAEPFGINDRGQIVGSGTISNEDHAFLLTPAFRTALGNNVTVSPPGSGTTITFSNVSYGGYTSVAISNSGPVPPAEFQLLGNYYDIKTTAEVEGSPVTVCITDPAVTADSRLLHYEGSLVGWVDVTITPVVPPTICGQADWLSPFVIAQRLPVAVCQNVTAAASSSCTASASIDNGSYDPDGYPITLTQSPEGPYPLGSYAVTLTATDSKGLSSQCIGTVTVVDNTPSSITDVSANPSKLWPPNHKMVDVVINYNVTDNCTAQPVCRISRVTSNEPISNADYAILDAHHVNLTADRLGSGSGRIYTIAVTCTDASNNSSSQAVAVIVPHDQRK